MANAATPHRVALVTWGNCLEHDFLQPIGVTLTAFRRSFTASWHFAYVLALREAGVETTSFAFSCCRHQPEHFVHEPTQSRFWLLPAPPAYRLWRRRSGDKRSLLADYLATPLLALGRVIRSERCTAVLVQGHDYARFDAVVLLGRLLGLPVYSTYQGGADLRSGRIIDRIRRWSFHRAAGLIVPPEVELARIQRRYEIDAGPVARILNPIDTGFWRPSDKQAARHRFGLSSADVVFAWHGRVGVAQKGLDTLIEAWTRAIPHMSSPAILHLLGSGSERLVLESLVARTPHVRWIDRFADDREEIRDFLSAADAYIFTSRAEGFAVAPGEALACGLPVIASHATPGIDELFPQSDADGGLLVPTLDPAVLAEAIVALARDDGRRTALSARALVRARELSLQNVGAQLAAMMALRPAERTDVTVPVGRRVPAEPLRILNLHPLGCRVGEPFNAQPDGNSAIVAVAENATIATSIVFEGHHLPTTFGHAGLVSATLPARLLRRARSCPVQLSDGVRWSDAVSFEILG